MKRIIAVLVAVCFLCCMLAGCGDNKVIDKVEYGTYGLINQSEMKNPNIQYRLIVGNIVWSVLLVETIIAPIYFLGFSMYEPVAPKQNFTPGAVN